MASEPMARKGGWVVAGRDDVMRGAGKGETRRIGVQGAFTLFGKQVENAAPQIWISVSRHFRHIPLDREHIGRARRSLALDMPAYLACCDYQGVMWMLGTATSIRLVLPVHERT